MTGPRTTAWPGRWLVVSDLHLGRRTTYHSEQFAAFLSAVAAEATAKATAGPAGVPAGKPAAPPVGPPALLLLGDVLDLLPDPVGGRRADPAARAAAQGAGASVRRADQVLAGQAEVVRGLRAVLDAGVEVHWVPGNHDIALADPAVAATVQAAFAGAGHGVRLHPWYLHVPGLLFAEHGHQHHELNRFPCPLSQVSAAGQVFQPPAVWIRPVVRGPGVRVRARSAVAALASLRAATRPGPRGDGGHAVVAKAAASGLNPRAVEALREVTRVPITASLVRPAVRRLRHADVHAYLRAGAEGTARVLDAFGVDAPLLVCGHVHDACVTPLGTTGRRYANSGTWSPDARGAQRRARGEKGCPFLDVVAGPGSPSATVRWWDQERAAGGDGQPA